MVVNQLPFTVKIDPNGSNVDISSKIVSIDHCKFQGTGRIRTASIMLEAEEGAFITNTNGGATPQINEFDKIEIEWQDENENFKTGLFEVDTELAQKVAGGGTLPLELKGRERALQDIKTTAYFEFFTPFSALATLGIIYNDNKGTAQPLLTIAFSDSGPLRGVTNIYDFTSEVSIYDAIMHVINRLNQPTSNGGVGNFYSIVFSDTLGDDIQMDVKIQGSGIAPPTIQPTITDPTHSFTYRIDSKQANQVFVRGLPNASAVPTEFHDFSSIVEEINNYPGYVSTATYNSGQRIIEAGIIYEANTTVPISTPPPNASFWDVKTVVDIIGPTATTNYSEFTRNKAVVTKNSCSNPTNNFLASGFDSPAFPDGNLVVRETFYTRDFVNIRTVNDTTIASDPVNKFYLRGQAQSGLYKGFRILVDTENGTLNPGGSFGDGAGTIFSDRFGRSFENAMVQWTGSEWIVFLSPVAPTVQDRAITHCCVLAEGKVYEYNAADATEKQKLAVRKSDVFRGGTSTGPFRWLDFCDAAGENDAFHHPKNIETTTGLLTPEIRANQDISAYLTNSALKITYEFTITSPLFEVVERVGNFAQTVWDTALDIFGNLFEDTVAPTPTEIAEFQTTQFYDIGWWYALPFPYPLSEFNGITEDVGDLYGLGDDPNNLATTLFGSLDIQNSTFSRQGKTGLNHDQVSDMGGPFTALAFNFRFQTIVLGGSQQPFRGDIPFTVTIYDDLSQVWRADFTYRHMGDIEDISIPFSSFTVNRPSRNPWSIDTLLINLIHTPELEIRSIFQERRVRLITWQLKSSYDEDERYMPFNTDNFLASLFGLGTFQNIGEIDSLRLLKQPFVSSGTEPTRVLNAETFEATNTRNKRQLEAIAIAEEQRRSHKFESYTYVKDIQCDLVTEQSVFLEDQDMIKFADRNETSPGASDGDPNTRKLVVMTEDFSYNAEGSQGGALQTLTLAKRLETA
jgi:hypothetical protein